MERKKTYYISTVAVVIILVLSFSGYTYYADAEAVSKTQVEIENLNLIKIYTNGLSLSFSVKFINPADREINDLSADFDIYINSIKIGIGKFSNIDIEPQDETSKQMTITVSYSGLAQSAIQIIKDFINGQKTGFSIMGTIKADALFGLIETSHKFVAKN